jgi:hypothetical protein
METYRQPNAALQARYATSRRSRCSSMRHSTERGLPASWTTLLVHDAMDKGYFVIARSVWDHERLQDDAPFSRREAWLWLISEAAWRSERRSYCTYKVDLRRGQLAASERFLAEKWGWSRSAVRRFLQSLKRAAMLELAVVSVVGAGPEPTTTLITICNYDKYQFGRSARGKAGPTFKHFDRNPEPASGPTFDATTDCDGDEINTDRSVGGPTSEPTPGPSPGPNINKEEESKKGRRERGADAPLTPGDQDEIPAQEILPSATTPKASTSAQASRPKAARGTRLPDGWEPDLA